MRRIALGVLVLCTAIVGTAAVAASPHMAPIQKFLDTFNSGDMAGAATTHTKTADLTIVDELAPYAWQGPQAFQTWSADLGKDADKRGITDQAVKISVPIREEVAGDRAYVVVPAVYTFKERGVAMREAAHMTFVLKKGTDGWLIHGWTWTGPKPESVAAAGKS